MKENMNNQPTEQQQTDLEDGEFPTASDEPQEGWLRISDEPTEPEDGAHPQFLEFPTLRNPDDQGGPTSVYQGPIDQILQITVRYENLINGRPATKGLRNLHRLPDSMRIFPPEKEVE